MQELDWKHDPHMDEFGWDQLLASDCAKKMTDRLHEEVESTSAMAVLMDPTLTRVQYVESLRSMAKAILPVEQELLRLQSVWQSSFPSVTNRPQAGQIIDDFQALMAGESMILLTPWRIASLEEAAGVLYVLEGSANGAMFLSKNIQASLNLDEATGLKYFLESARNARERWSAFKSELNSVIQTPHQKQIMTRSAVAMFKLFLISSSSS